MVYSYIACEDNMGQATTKMFFLAFSWYYFYRNLAITMHMLTLYSTNKEHDSYTPNPCKAS